MNVTYADVGYLGLGDVWFRDLVAGEAATATAPVPLGRGMDLHTRAGEGTVELATKRLRIRLADAADATTVVVAFDTPHGPFRAEVVVERPEGHESLTVVIPWADRRFQCTTKDVARPAQGTITWGDRRYELAADGSSWGCLDFGRGKWPYRTTWNWGAAAGMADGRRVGLQEGGKGPTAQA